MKNEPFIVLESEITEDKYKAEIKTLLEDEDGISECTCCCTCQECS